MALLNYIEDLQYISMFLLLPQGKRKTETIGFFILMIIVETFFCVFCDSRSLHHRAESPTPSCVSMKSDQSMDFPMNFSNEPGPSNTK